MHLARLKISASFISTKLKMWEHQLVGVFTSAGMFSRIRAAWRASSRVLKTAGRAAAADQTEKSITDVTPSSNIFTV